MKKLFSIAICLLAGANAAAADDPWKLELTAPIRTWDEAVPLGNGLLGGLLWGEDSTIRLSLDRGDLWDERPAPDMPWDKFNFANLIRLVQEQKDGEITAIFDRNYSDAHPTKIPAGRLEIVLDPAQQVQRFELDLAAAQGRVLLQDNTRLDVFFSAAQPVALMRFSGTGPKSLRLLPPASVKALGYPDPDTGSEAGTQWFLQAAAEGLSYCVCLQTRRTNDATLLAVTVTSTCDGADPVAVARQRVSAALDSGYDALLAVHTAWWSKFWSQSQVTVPDIDIQRHYNLVRYFYGAASRRGAPPMPLQGVWTADAESLPPWKGDYHNDLNTQMTYIAYQAAGHFDEGAAFLDFMWDLLPAYRKFAKEFYGTPGAAVPGVMSLAGQPLGGWPQYSLSPVQGAWIGHLFYLHWRYTGDDQFLRERAFPWCREIGESLRSLLREENGLLKLPLSASPEIFDNSLRAWVKPNSNYDIACLRMFFLALSEMAAAASDPAAAEQWAKTARGLGEFHVRPDHVLKISENEDLPGSHRHLSNLIGIYPFNLMSIDGGDRDRAVIAASLKQWDALGTQAWCGYSFSWMACLRARVGDAESALHNLDIFTKAFILRNGFHVNGDQLRAGFSSFIYRPFTLEGNFLAPQAVHEMLLQSWSPTPGVRDTQVLRIFPATPWRWHAAAFTDLRAEGGYRVSAKREHNATTSFRITASRDGVVRIRDNFDGRTLQWSRNDIQKVGENFQVVLKSGETLIGNLQKPDAIPPAPADAAEELKLPGLIRPIQLPLRLGADSNSNNRFLGDIARASVFDRALRPVEIVKLADHSSNDVASLPGCVVAWDLGRFADGDCPGAGRAALVMKAVGQVTVVDADPPLSGKVVRFDGQGYLETPHQPVLDCPNGLTLEAWIRPGVLPASGGRILDKSPAGQAVGYLFDTYPGNSLRVIVSDPWLGYKTELQPGRWVHVAATVDETTRKTLLYVDGKPVAER